MTQPMRVVIGMRVRLRKPHPCGSDEWVVTRAGADVGLACDRCARRVMLEREEFERRVRQIVSMPNEAAPSNQPDPAPATLAASRPAAAIDAAAPASSGSLPDVISKSGKAAE